jgi:hypothetical protein
VANAAGTAEAADLLDAQGGKPVAAADRTATGKEHFELLDGLRGTAAMLVVLFHIQGITELGWREGHSSSRPACGRFLLCVVTLGSLDQGSGFC